jgi:hypothetical protein
MAEEYEPLYERVTRIDLQLALVYYPILIGLAKKNEVITYGALVELAKSIYPDNPVVQSAIPVTTGRRLDVVRSFTSVEGLPDITCLVINRHRGLPGEKFPGDPVEVRNAVADFNWSDFMPKFDMFVTATQTELDKRVKRKRVSEQKAIELMSSYYFANRDTLNLPDNKKITPYRPFIIENIMEGYSMECAFKQAMELIAENENFPNA